MNEHQTRRRFSTTGAIQTGLALVISIGTIMGVFAGYITLPQKVKAFEDNQAKMWEHIHKTDETRTLDHEILVRLEEQTKQIQATQQEIKNDLREHVREPAKPRNP